MKKISPLVLLVLTACSASSSPYSEDELKKQLDFDCVIEQKPTIPKETEILYNYAHYQDLHRLWTGKAGDWNDLAKYYRIAAANGNYKANGRLQYLLYSNRIITENNKKEVIELNESLEKILLATAYFGYYFYLKKEYGVKTISMGELSYLRKSAELGNKDAQFVLGDMILSVKDKQTFLLRKTIRDKLLNCALLQGQGDAAEELGFTHRDEKEYQKSLNTFHLGVKAGNSLSARFLMKSFSKNVLPRNDLKLSMDLERSVRYEMIATYLSRNEFLDPKVPDLDEIVPLPPAKLPAWDGKIAFQRWFEGPSPEKPSDELMKKLAEKAGLDWQTGLPLKK